VDEVSKLRHKVDGDIVVYASSRLVHTLMEHDLADELRLMTYPLVVGVELDDGWEPTSARVPGREVPRIRLVADERPRVP
jgi:dihydrofolate reductase